MPDGRSKQKQKLLYLQKILLEYTDEQHRLTGPELIEKLALYGISAERKTIYDDVQSLAETGLDIVTERQGHSNVYYVGGALCSRRRRCLVEIFDAEKIERAHKKAAAAHKPLQRPAFEKNRLRRQPREDL